MADQVNKDAVIRFLAGQEANLHKATIENGTVYFALKPDPLDSSKTIGSIYLDAEGKRVMMSGESLAILDGKGDQILTKYIQGINFDANTGAQGIITYVKGNGDDVNVDIPSASATAAGFVTTGDQTFAGTKTFNNDIVISGDYTNIQKVGVNTSWISGRDVALVKLTSCTGYNVIMSMKTTNGDWSYGVNTDDIAYWTYTPDTQYTAKDNKNFTQMKLTPAGKLITVDSETGHLFAKSIAVGTDNTNYKLYNSGTTYLADTLEVAARATVDTLKISKTNAAKHIEFAREGFNYIATATGGCIAFLPNGASTGEDASRLIVEDGGIRPGATNTYNLGTDKKRWKGIYGNTLNISGASTLSGELALGGNLSVGGTLEVAGATTLNSSLSVTGKTTLSSLVEIGNDLVVTGAILGKDKMTLGQADLNTNYTFYVTGASGFNGKITANNTLHLTNTTDASASSDNNVALIIGDRAGTHIIMDGNELMAKADGSTAGSLYLNNDGGLVTVGSGGVTTSGYSDTTGANGFRIRRNGITYGRFYAVTEGTTSVTGVGQLTLGNSTKTGNANNAVGIIRLYGLDDKYTDIRTVQGAGNYAFYLSNHGQTGYSLARGTVKAYGGLVKPVWFNASGNVVEFVDTIGTTAIPTYLKDGEITTITPADMFSVLKWNDGTTAGPELDITIGTYRRTAIIPHATKDKSGVVTTDAQTFSGDKTFANAITVTGKAIFKSKVEVDNELTAKGNIIIQNDNPYVQFIEGNTTVGYIQADNNKIFVGIDQTKGLSIDSSGNVIVPKGHFTVSEGGAYIAGRYQGSGDDEGLIIGKASNSYAGLILGGPSSARSVFYLMPNNKANWRWNNGSASYDMYHPGVSGTFIAAPVKTVSGAATQTEGTVNIVPKFTGAFTVENSNITDDGSTITLGTKVVVQGNGSSYNEGIRVLPAQNGWSNIYFSATSAVSGAHPNGWLVGRRGANGSNYGVTGDFVIENENSNGSRFTLTQDGILHNMGEIITKSANAFRAIYGNFGVFLRNDGSDTYFLITASGKQYEGWNDLRPFYFNNTTGNVTMAHNVAIGTNLTVNGNTLNKGALTVGQNSMADTSKYKFYVNGTSYVVGAAHFNSTVKIVNDLTVDGDIYSNAGIHNTGNIFISNSNPYIQFTDTANSNQVYYIQGYQGNLYLGSTSTKSPWIDKNGVLHTISEQYTDNYTTAGLNLHNSDIVGVNSIYTADNSEGASEGIHFYRSATAVDTIWASNGVLYFAPNRTIGSSSATSYQILHTNNYSGILDGRYVNTSGDSMYGRLSISAQDTGTSPGGATLELREYNLGGSNNTHDAANAPRLGFHWGSRYWAQFALFDNALRLYNSELTGYYPFIAGAITGDRGTFGGYNNTSYSLSTASFICNSWIRTTGNTGWYNESYSGGWYMADSTWIRNYNNKSLYMSTANIRTDLVAGGSWIVGSHDGAIQVRAATTGTAGSFFQSWFSGKTPSGSWGIGPLAGYNDLYFVFGTDANYNANSNTTANIKFGSDGKVWGAVWNDYAEFRQAETIEPGRVVVEHRSGEMKLSTERLQPGANVISDTYGFTIGETDKCKTPIAVAGRVLVYPNESIETYELGDAVCSGPNGTVSKMTREEIWKYPERIIGTVSEIPTYKTWGSGNVEVNGRIWIKVK